MWRALVVFIYFWLYMVFSFPALLMVILTKATGQQQLNQRIVLAITRHWARSLIALTGSDIRVVGQEHIPQDTAVLVVSNHQSNFDIPIILASVNKSIAFIAKAELGYLPVFSLWMKYIGCVMMKRSDKRQSLKAINHAIDKMKNGLSFVIFPEGTRSVDGRLAEFKAGSFKLATKAGVPVLPVSIDGSFRMMKKKSFKISPVRMTVTILPVIPIEGQDPPQLAVTAQQVIEKHVSHG